MAGALPQQRLLLELLVVLRHIAGPSKARESILWRTLEECRQAHWITISEVNPDSLSVDITRTGRAAVQDTS